MKYLIFAIAAAGLFAACNPKTSEIAEVAETSAEATEEATSTEGDMPKADIGEGKVLFIKDCASCHGYTSGPNNVAELDNFTKAQVDAVLPKMIKNAQFDETQARQVTAYIYWELEN